MQKNSSSTNTTCIITNFITGIIKCYSVRPFVGLKIYYCIIITIKMTWCHGHTFWSLQILCASPVRFVFVIYARAHNTPLRVEPLRVLIEIITAPTKNSYYIQVTYIYNTMPVPVQYQNRKIKHKSVVGYVQYV
jgi:hypothetical protein